MGIRKTIKDSFEASGRLKSLIIFFAIAHIVFLVFGQWSVAEGLPGVVYLRSEMLKEIQELPYLKPLTGALADSLILKILYTFSFNLLFGAFLSTTLMGFVFFLPYVIAVWRSFTIGILIYGMNTTPLTNVIFYGTFLLEFGAYTLSSAVGTDIGLSLLLPRRKGTESRMEALRAAFSSGRKIYFIIIIILFVSAIWEISWLHYLGPIAKPNFLQVK